MKIKTIKMVSTENKVDQQFIDFINEIKGESIQSSVELDGVLKFVIEQDIKVSVHNDSNFIGLATMYGLFFNLNYLNRFTKCMQLYVILHEIGHYKRFLKFGKEIIIDKFSEPDFDIFANMIINEEIIADKYASLVYYKLTGKLLPKNITQGLSDENIAKEYKNRLQHVNIEHDENKYKNTLKELYGIDV